MNISEDSTVLSSWKEIASYLGKGVRTVQRWERHLGLPVRRPIGASQKSAVLLYRGDVDVWLATRFSARGVEKSEAHADNSLLTVRLTLREGLQTARELRRANHRLLEQIHTSIGMLTQRCDLLSAQQQWEFQRSGEPVAVPDSQEPRGVASSSVRSEHIA